MKIPVKAAVFLACILLLVMVLMAVTSTSVRANEAEEALAHAVETSLQQLKEQGDYAIGDQTEWIADFNQALLTQINSDSKIELKVLSADLDIGLLDIQVTETYHTVGGTQKSVACRKTVLLEEYSQKQAFYTVRFQVGDTVFQTYSLYGGSLVVDPGKPKVEGKTFRYWKLAGQAGPVDLATLTVTGDLTLQAVF